MIAAVCRDLPGNRAERCTWLVASSVEEATEWHLQSAMGEGPGIPAPLFAKDLDELKVRLARMYGDEDDCGSRFLERESTRFWNPKTNKFGDSYNDASVRVPCIDIRKYPVYKCNSDIDAMQLKIKARGGDPVLLNGCSLGSKHLGNSDELLKEGYIYENVGGYYKLSFNPKRAKRRAMQPEYTKKAKLTKGQILVDSISRASMALGGEVDNVTCFAYITTGYQKWTYPRRREECIKNLMYMVKFHKIMIGEDARFKNKAYLSFLQKSKPYLPGTQNNKEECVQKLGKWIKSELRRYAFTQRKRRRKVTPKK